LTEKKEGYGALKYAASWKGREGRGIWDMGIAASGIKAF
jgi:hypothetical protein